MTDSLVAFARTGNPSTTALTWPRFDAGNQQFLELGTEARVAPWPDLRRLAFFASIEAAREPGGSSPRD